MSTDISASRHELVARIRERVIERGTPRLELLFIISLAGAAAFLVSFLALNSGLSSMPLRYPLAVAGGYLVFLALIRVWIAWHRGETAFDPDFDLGVLDVDLPIARKPPAPDFFDGGGSGGGGATASFQGNSPVRAMSTPPMQSSSRGGGFSLDLDDAWPIVLAVICALGGIAAVIYVIYFAPLLLAEVALDAAIVSGLYRRLRREEMSHWAATTVRHTIVPACVLIVFAAGLGFALHAAAPDAVSIGGVIRQLSLD